MPPISLLTDLAGIARLAGVQRPVASVWRTRFASASDPFPLSIGRKNGRDQFDVLTVAQWLARTDHGNNPDVLADAAASAAPSDFNIADSAHVDRLDALLTLRAGSGDPVGVTATELQERVRSADADDEFLATEVLAAREAWGEWADLLADAAYSPGHASRLLERRHAATMASAGSSGPITQEAEALLVEMIEGLRADAAEQVGIDGAVAPALVSELLSRAGNVDLVVPPTADGRRIRRRLLCDGFAPPAVQPSPNAPVVSLTRLTMGVANSLPELLLRLGDRVGGMRKQDRAIVVAPTAVLTDALSAGDALARADLLRSGRVRAIVKLPAGLVVTAPREALALWVLGSNEDVPIADRITAVGDLTGVSLSRAARADLTSDVLAAIGSVRLARAHAFRFTRLVRTTSLVATRGELVAGGRRASVNPQATGDLPARLDAALADLGGDAPGLALAPTAGPALAPAAVDDLIADGHLRVLSGTRLTKDAFLASGLVVVGADDLDHLAAIGARRVDPLDFAAAHPAARLTVAGDVVFRTAPTARAWVDPDGSKVVAYPARVLRIDPADPGGLVPELVAADITSADGGPAAWRRWRLRRVVAQAADPLRAALADLAARRQDLDRRIAALDAYTELLTAGVVSGVVTLTDHTADAASKH